MDGSIRLDLYRNGETMCALCDGRSIDDYVLGVEGLIDRYGWALQYVNSDADTVFGAGSARVDNDAVYGDLVHEDLVYEVHIIPAFCYTVGLTALGHPELILTGRSASESASVLNILARRVLLDGHSLEAGCECSAGGLGLSFVDVAEPGDWLLMAHRVYPGRDVGAVQAVWRDVEGNLPWEGPFPSTVVQPVLGPPPGWDEEFD